MNKFVALTLVIGVALGLFYFTPLKNKVAAFFGYSSLETKCITQDGQVYYGKVPEGIVCEKTESIDGPVTIFESD